MSFFRDGHRERYWFNRSSASMEIDAVHRDLINGDEVVGLHREHWGFAAWKQERLSM